MGNSKIGRLKLVKTIIRAEPGRLVFYHLDKRKKIAIAGKNLELLRQWLTTGVENELIIKLNNRIGSFTVRTHACTGNRNSQRMAPFDAMVQPIING